MGSKHFREKIFSVELIIFPKPLYSLHFCFPACNSQVKISRTISAMAGFTQFSLLVEFLFLKFLLIFLIFQYIIAGRIKVPLTFTEVSGTYLMVLSPHHIMALKGATGHSGKRTE